MKLPFESQPLGGAAVEVQTDPFIFRWTVNESGYEWSDEADGKMRLFPRYVPGAGGLWRYTPAPALFREFAELSPTGDAIREFAGRYGDLFNQWDISHTVVRGKRWVGGTSLDRWKAKIGDMRRLVDMWDQIQDGGRHGELKKVIVRTENEICYKRGSTTDVTLARGSALSRFNPKDVLLPARCALQYEINKRLTDTETPTLIIPTLTWTPDWHQRIVFKPCNLLAEMFMRFAQAVTGEFRLKQCAVCDEYFQVGLGGKRRHKKTCGSKCRQALSRASRKTVR